MEQDRSSARLENTFFFLIVVTVVVIAVAAATARAFHSVFADGDLNALQREAFAELGALDHTRELFGREDLEGLAEDRGQDGRGSVVDHWGGIASLGGG